MSAPGLWSWELESVLALPCVALMGAYALALRRARRLARTRPPGFGHAVPFAVGWLALVVALLSPLDPIGDRYLLSAHVLQHVLLADIAPALIVLGIRAPVIPLGLSRSVLRQTAHAGWLGRVWGVATRPLVALPLWALATWAWSVPAVFDAAAAHPALHAAEHATLMWTGFALWWLIVDPLPSDRRKPHGRRLAMLAFTRAATAAVCLPLTWLGHTLYPRYAEAPRAYGISALTDQQLAGAGMCFVEFLVFGIAFAVVFVDALAREERQSAAADLRAAGR